MQLVSRLQLGQGQGEHVESEAEVRVTAEGGEKDATQKTAAYCCRAV